MSHIIIDGKIQQGDEKCDLCGKPLWKENIDSFGHVSRELENASIGKNGNFHNECKK